MHKQGSFYDSIILILRTGDMNDGFPGHIIRNWKNRFFVLQMANEGNQKVFRLLYYKEQANYEDTPPTGAVTIVGATTAVNDAPPGL
jgi:hypothetical protein